jgi:hypothetical protein
VQGQKTGGRVAGTPNRASRTLKTFLDGVFEAALENPAYRERLVNDIVRGTLDPMSLRTLLAYWAGAPRMAVDHTHRGHVTLEQIVAGTVPADDADAEAEP